MQILGFNFKKAVGEPLTELIASLIISKISSGLDEAVKSQILTQQREVEYLKIYQDEDDYNRLMKVFGSTSK